MIGFIYFIACEPMAALKIGYTKRAPVKRLANLQTGCPSRLKLLMQVSGSLEDEARLHAAFRPLHIQGEWFRLEGKLSGLLDWLMVDGRQQVDRCQFEDALHDVIFQNGAWTPFHEAPEAEFDRTASWGPIACMVSE